MKSIEEQIKIISKGVDEIINVEDLKSKIRKITKDRKTYDS